MSIELEQFLEFAIAANSGAVKQIFEGLGDMLADANRDISHATTKPSDLTDLVKYRANLQACADAILLARARLDFD